MRPNLLMRLLAFSRGFSPPLHRVELPVLGAFGALWVVGLLFLPANLPDWDAFVFVQTHYLAPIELAALLQAGLVLALRRRRLGHPIASPGLTLTLLAVTACVVFLHFNFKAWMPLVNPLVFDPSFARIDGALSPLVDAMRRLRALATDLSPVSLDPAYHLGFVALFFVSFLLHGLWDRALRFRRLVLTVNLILLAGGLSYWVLPAIGPFTDGPGMNALATEAQRQMILGLHATLSTGAFPQGYFVQPLAAMPSLHVAQTLALAMAAWQLSRATALVYAPFVIWVAIEAVASGFHYVIDLPAGALLALGCHRWSRRLLEGRQDATQPAAAAA